MRHVNNNKISHKDPKVVSNIIEELEGHFGKLSVNQGRSHDYLGMTICYTEDGNVALNMTKKIKEICETFIEEIYGDVTSPATQKLYKVIQPKIFQSGDWKKRITFGDSKITIHY